MSRTGKAIPKSGHIQALTRKTHGENMGIQHMSTKPKCVIITGRPGSGKTTLAGKLCAALYLPKISRDEVKEGYVNTFGVKHDSLPADTNGVVNEVFFETILTLLKGNISIVIEAAFQQKLWDLVVPRINEIAHTCIIVCDLNADLSARRHLERGLANPDREFYHGDKRVTLFRETGQFEPGEEYLPPEYDVPALSVSTLDGYAPSLEEIVAFVKSHGPVVDHSV
jgi:energy-coupling factor transporter ATP-binding protein EcfA2